VTKNEDKCVTFWGTHGCDLPKDHKDNKHICIDEEESEICCAIIEIARPVFTGWVEEGFTIDQGRRWGITLNEGLVVGIFE
jgi:hypothetical protein